MNWADQPRDEHGKFTTDCPARALVYPHPHESIDCRCIWAEGGHDFHRIVYAGPLDHLDVGMADGGAVTLHIGAGFIEWRCWTPGQVMAALIVSQIVSVFWPGLTLEAGS